MISPFKHEREFPFSATSVYFSGVLTLPAKKLFKNIEYQNMSSEEQIRLLSHIAYDTTCKDNIKYVSFEYHPERNKAKPCLHMNLLFEYNNCFVPFWKDQIITKTKIYTLDKICYYGAINTRIDTYNWVNYMYKDYPNHIYQIQDYYYELHDEYLTNRQRVINNPLINELDYK